MAIAVSASALLSACTISPQTEAPTARASSSTLPPPTGDMSQGMALLSMPREPVLGNSLLARDFMELGFQLESGRPLSRFTRFEGPVTVSFAGAAPASARTELSNLTARLRHEAGIAITAAPATDPQANHIAIEMVSKAQLRSAAPNIACFVVPNVVSFAEYQAGRRDGTTDWTRVTQRRKAAVFMPADATPQEIRDCLHEEISQALGPLNDSFRLPNTVWNDDNFHATLTAQDMKILRTWYDPALHSGMSQPEVLSALPAILPRLYPSGGSVNRLIEDPTPSSFTNAITKAMSAGSTRARQAAAQQAIQIAAGQGWNDNRMGFAQYVMGRLTLDSDPSMALRSFLNAARIYSATPGASMQAAHVDMQLANFALASGRSDQAIALAERAMGPARSGQNAVLVSTLNMILSEAHDLQGNSADAQQARLDSMTPARYAFGSNAEARSRAADVAALARAGADRVN